jgi:hypothetical protein
MIRTHLAAPAEFDEDQSHSGLLIDAVSSE